MTEVRDNPAAHRFELVVDRHLAFSEYTLEGDVITFTHTLVPPAIEGRGVAQPADFRRACPDPRPRP